ncbi:RND family efflux transporter MFP subunit [Thiogranum longum]|uniref:RND family efflux transporter MFP subunit n=1 Tax=Thiogranum longum TaxID=1537524 RepID=A0A4R1H8L8_9GAMM|nr:efflux RND transporter periplasmic adaptor subunit [Thiogranum longum]TCK16851.1 RND family efflux transporter MFP subunit [Thiogranum longum]
MSFFSLTLNAAITGLVLQLASLPSIAAPATLKTTQAGYQLMPDEQRFDGLVEAVYQSTISAQTAGEIIELPFDVNDYVPKGALIVRLDDKRQKAQLDQAIASEARARAQLADAESDYRRKQQLFKKKVLGKATLDKAETALKSARAGLELAQAKLDQAREQWEYTRVRAPFAGVMIERLVEIGEHARTGTPLATGLSLEKLRVQVAIPAHYAGHIRENLQARVQKPGGQEWLESTDITLFPFADPHSHTFTARVQLPEGQHGMYPGVLAKVAFLVGRQQALLIPDSAIIHRSEVTGVYVVADSGRIYFRQLRIGRPAAGNMRVVLAGLEEGEAVALDPVAAGIALKQQVNTVSHE